MRCPRCNLSRGHATPPPRAWFVRPCSLQSFHLNVFSKGCRFSCCLCRLPCAIQHIIERTQSSILELFTSLNTSDPLLLQIDGSCNKPVLIRVQLKCGGIDRNTQIQSCEFLINRPRDAYTLTFFCCALVFAPFTKRMGPLLLVASMYLPQRVTHFISQATVTFNAGVFACKHLPSSRTPSARDSRRMKRPSS